MTARKLLRRSFLLACLLSLSSLVSVVSLAAPTQPAVAGDWQGTLTFNGNELHVALHITGAGDALKATVDSIDQNAFAIPVTTIAFSASTLTFTVDSLHASYTGKLSADGASLTGTFTQGAGTLPLNFARLSTTEPAKADKSVDSIAGTWTGAFNLPSGKLPVMLHFTSTGGKLTATMDSPQQGAAGIAVTSITRAGSTLHMTVSSLDATFDGSFTPDLQTLTGTWTQRGTSMPITLTRSAGATATPEPTTP